MKIKQGKKEGIEIGEKKGKKEGKIETAINLLNMGIDIETIIKATGLKQEEIEALKK
jgi:predicted transposase/invertase (TIGR01784 family)